MTISALDFLMHKIITSPDSKQPMIDLDYHKAISDLIKKAITNDQ